MNLRASKYAPHIARGTAVIKSAVTKKEALAPVKSEESPINATHGGTLALDPNPTVCQESAYMRSKSRALDGASGKAPPTSCPNRFREAKSAINVTKREIDNIGRFASHVIGEGAFTSSISAFSRASSLRSRADEVLVPESLLMAVARHDLEIAAPVRSRAS